MSKYAIKCTTQADEWWSNEFGWATYADRDIFDQWERDNWRLPQDGAWVQEEEQGIIQRVTALVATIREKGSLDLEDPAVGTGALDEQLALTEDLLDTVEELLGDQEAGNRGHFTFDDGYDKQVLVVNVTEEGIIMDAFLNDEHVGTKGMMADEWFDAIAGPKTEANFIEEQP